MGGTVRCKQVLVLTELVTSITDGMSSVQCIRGDNCSGPRV